MVIDALNEEARNEARDNVVESKKQEAIKVIDIAEGSKMTGKERRSRVLK